MKMYRILVLAILCLALTGCTTITCFLAGTQISTPTGLIAIESLLPGDTVLSIDPNSSEPVFALVHSIHSSMATGYLLIETTDGNSVKVTEHHPFFTSERRQFCAANSLVPGDSLWVWSGNTLKSTLISNITKVTGSVAVYHLVIDRNPHTFLSNGYLVHNKTPPPPDPISISVTSVPDRAGWILVNGQDSLGQIPDMVFSTFPYASVRFEAVPRSGWRFNRWEGAAQTLDSVVTHATFESPPNWIRCVFDTIQ